MSTKGGKGSSSAETQNTATNNQVATESGIAVGGTNNSANISVTTSDPEVLEAALKSNTDVNQFATDAVTTLAGTSILAQNSLATKFGQNVSDLAAQNINLLQSVNQENTATTLAGLDVAKGALDQSFAISRSVAPQDPSYAQETLAQNNSKTIIWIVLGMLGLGIVFFFGFKKKA